MSKASRERQKQREANTQKNEWKPCMKLIHKTTGKDFYLYLPDEAISYIRMHPACLAMVNHAMETLSMNDPDLDDSIVLLWQETCYGDLTGVISTNPCKFAA